MLEHLRKLTDEELRSMKDAAKIKREARKFWRANHAGIDKLAERYPAYASDIARIRAGSLKSAIKMACIDCCGSRTEATRCTATACALYTFRPGASLD